jgi:hypothetical protein
MTVHDQWMKQSREIPELGNEEKKNHAYIHKNA